ncbi:uncharacterized protein LOC141680198 [Apium graveolens]|uniref:uncharacterized protein LOC141680198 n=1 Tax=Apium graveolens TaxID=4045 RepID=UPI003D7AEBAC
MHPDKSLGPGLDGMNPAFYQQFWNIVSNDIMDMCLKVLATGSMPQNLNDTLVVLISKKNQPERITDLRPISLCNVVSKIISKMLANRLKVLLPSIISESQSAFIPGSINKEKRGGWFTPWIRIARNAPTISHLFFTDDDYLFFRATVEEAQCIKGCLKQYEKAAGQQVNFQKSSIHFSNNTTSSMVEAVSQNLQVAFNRESSFYLGLPSYMGRNKMEVFQYVKEMVWNRMQGWKGKILSRGGKEILINLVIEAIPSYVMSVFLLPKSLCDEIEILMNKFWWVVVNMLCT